MSTEIYQLSREAILADRPSDPLLFIVRSRQAIFGGLVDGVMRGETFLALIGPAGIGKTTMADAIRGELTSRSVRVLQVSRGDGDAISLRAMASQILGVPQSELNDDVVIEELYHVMAAREDCDQGFVLIIDDAELLRADALAYLRLLTIVATTSMPQVVFVGRPEFWDTEDGRQPALQTLITARWELAPLTAEESHEFIAQSYVAPAHDMAVAFTTDGLAALVRHGAGSCGRLAALLSLAQGILAESHERSLTLTVINAAAALLDGSGIEQPADKLPQSAIDHAALEQAGGALLVLRDESAEPTADDVAEASPVTVRRPLGIGRLLGSAGVAAILSTVVAATGWQVAIHRTTALAATVGAVDTLSAQVRSAAHSASVAIQAKIAQITVIDVTSGPAKKTNRPATQRSDVGEAEPNMSAQAEPPATGMDVRTAIDRLPETVAAALPLVSAAVITTEFDGDAAATTSAIDAAPPIEAKVPSATSKMDAATVVQPASEGAATSQSAASVARAAAPSEPQAPLVASVASPTAATALELKAAAPAGSSHLMTPAASVTEYSAQGSVDANATPVSLAAVTTAPELKIVPDARITAPARTDDQPPPAAIATLPADSVRGSNGANAAQPAPASAEPERSVRVALQNAPVKPEAGAAAPRHPDTPAMTQLVSRGDDELALGDVLAARLFYTRAAALGSAHAATLAGKTYDPMFLATIQANGVAPDPAAASSWYRKAVTLGDQEAASRLGGLRATR